MNIWDGRGMVHSFVTTALNVGQFNAPDRFTHREGTTAKDLKYSPQLRSHSKVLALRSMNYKMLINYILNCTITICKSAKWISSTMMQMDSKNEPIRKPWRLHEA